MPSTPQTPHGRVIANDFSSPQLINENEGNDKVYVKCYPKSKPHSTHFKGEFDMDARIPDFSFLTNYPPGRANELPEGTKCCVMCGEIRGCNPGKSTKTKSMKSSEGYSQDTVVIPNQNKGLCTLCDVEVWVIKKDDTEIKWCKGCKNFKAWCTFGEKGSATKCMCCRDRQREKYAVAKKRKMDKMMDKTTTGSENDFKRPSFSN
jgi:hypothetical protein